jgi:hypothetical protein
MSPKLQNSREGLDRAYVQYREKRNIRQRCFYAHCEIACSPLKLRLNMWRVRALIPKECGILSDWRRDQ